MRWGLTKEKQRGKEVWCIKRWNGTHPERLPLEQYRHIRDNEAELRAFVKRLNVIQDTQAKVTFKHAFIDDNLIYGEYRDYLETRIPDPVSSAACLTMLNEYFLKFFVGRLDLMNPGDWAGQQTKWARFLLSEEAPASAKSKRMIVTEANRFMKWLSERRPGEFQLKHLEPLSKARLKDVEAQRLAAGEKKLRTYIKADDWKRIEKALPPEVRPFAMLAYHYGLRRQETMALTPEDVWEDYLEVHRQLKRRGVYRPLKGKEARKIPHWFSTPAQAYGWIEQALEYPQHPTTLTNGWKDCMKSLGLTHDFHDLRHSFITRAMSKYHWKEVQLAAGHKHASTTTRYDHDNRELEPKRFRPKAA